MTTILRRAGTNLAFNAGFVLAFALILGFHTGVNHVHHNRTFIMTPVPASGATK